MAGCVVPPIFKKFCCDLVLRSQLLSRYQDLGGQQVAGAFDIQPVGGSVQVYLGLF